MRDFTESAIQVAKDAGRILLKGYVNQEKNVSQKSGRELVTATDFASEEFICSRLKKLYPEWQIMAEERANTCDYNKGLCWIIDPLDGTNNFAHSVPFFCVSIALASEGEVISGVIHEPLRAETFYADDDGVFLNGEQIGVSDTATLERSFLATGFPYKRTTSTDNNMDHFNNFYFKVLGLRRVGSAALDLAYTACGRFDGFWELKLQPWDMAAGALIVKKAGGMATDFHNNSWHPGSDRIIANNGRIHEQMLMVINKDR